MGDSIEQAIQELYDEPLEAQKLQEAGRCLLEFLELLMEEAVEQKRKGEIQNEIQKRIN